MGVSKVLKICVLFGSFTCNATYVFLENGKKQNKKQPLCGQNSDLKAEE